MFAGAAFTDSADIKVDTEVVDTLVSLGVVNGYDDGSFKPNGTVTRAEMAKMIYVLRTGNSDASAYNDDKTSFTDIGSHWARGYIKYCQSLGIIAGKSNTKFVPNEKVSAQEAAKMLLVTLGYNAQKAGLVGTGWASKTNALADENGLLEDVTTSFTSACPRQYAAQLIYNTIFAHTVTLRDGEYTNMNLLGTDKLETVGEKYMSMKKWVGTFEGNEDVCGLDTGLIRVRGTLDGKEATKENPVTNADFKYSKLDLSYIGEEVSVLFKDATGGTVNRPDKKDTIYGVYVTGETKVYNITKDDLQDQKDAGTVRFDDKNHDVAGITTTDTANSAFVYINKNYGADTSAKVNQGATKSAEDLAEALSDLQEVSSDTIKFICNDDGDIVKAYVVESKLARVTAVNTDKVSINNRVGQLKKEDNDIYSDVKKDDIVVVTTLYNATATDSAAYSIVKKAETVEGKITGYNGTKKVTVDGKTYKIADETLSKTIDSDFTDSFANQIGETVTLYMINGMVYGAEMVTEGTKNYAVVETSDGTLNDKINPLKVAIMKADGSEVTVEVHKDSIEAANEDTELTAGKLIKYTDVSNGKIKITEIVNTVASTVAEHATQVVYDKDTKSFATEANGNGKKVTATDAVVFVQKDSDWYAYNIRNLDTIKVAGATTYNAATMLDDSKVVAAYVKLDKKPSGASSDTVYGIVSSENGTVKNGDDTYTSFTVDDGTDAPKTVLIEGAGIETLKKGDLVAFDLASDNVYATSDIKIYARYASNTLSLNVANASNAFKGFAGEYEAASILTYYDTQDNLLHKTTPHTVAVDDDVKVIYVDADDNKTVAETDVVHDGISNKANFVAVYDNDDTSKSIIAIFVADDSNIEQ
nr:S-layer homology domain-containing protein [Butyricicoccus sp. AF86-03b2A]